MQLKKPVQNPRRSSRVTAEVASLIWPQITNDESVAQLSEPLPTDPEAVVRFSLLLLSFNFTHARCGPGACAPAFSDVIILTHMDFEVQVDNLGCDSQVFHRVRPRPWLPHWGTESWPAGAPWVSGFSPNGGNRLYSDGGKLVYVLSEKGKEDCRNPPWRYLRPTWRGITFLTLGGFPAPRPGDGRFSSGKLPGGLAVPRTGRLLRRGSTRQYSLVRPTVGEPPFHGKVAWTLSSQTWPWKGRKHKTRKSKKKKGKGKFKIPGVKIIYSNPQYWNKFLIN